MCSSTAWAFARDYQGRAHIQPWLCGVTCELLRSGSGTALRYLLNQYWQCLTNHYLCQLPNLSLGQLFSTAQGTLPSLFVSPRFRFAQALSRSLASGVASDSADALTH